ncbi:hypothetical protein D5S17_20665 [Pseudonocardiaceae bacterium YIM PH 21723]|nr:hypothetical protein D5S17_20665 [Pseudonocardiaceae bacterium YIM PH 21723]
MVDSAPVNDFQDKDGRTIHLLCGGLRHINQEHPYDYFMPQCISEVLRFYSSKETSNSTPGNWFYSRPAPYPANRGIVIVKKENDEIVTAYTQGNGTDGPSAAWSECATIARK